MTKAIDTKGGFLVRDKEIESERVLMVRLKYYIVFSFFKKDTNIVNKIIPRCNHLHIRICFKPKT